MPRIKNYLTKKIYAHVIGYGKDRAYAHIMVPSHWKGHNVTIVEYKNGKTIGRAYVEKSFSTSVKRYNKVSCHISLSPAYMGDILEVTLDDHNELIHKMFSEESSSSTT